MPLVRATALWVDRHGDGGTCPKPGHSFLYEVDGERDRAGWWWCERHRNCRLLTWQQRARKGDAGTIPRQRLAIRADPVRRQVHRVRTLRREQDAARVAHGDAERGG